MQKQIVIIDGYNAIHGVPRWEAQLDVSLERGREALLAYCRRWMQTRGDVWLFYVVFDGDSTVQASHSSSGSGIRVVYTATGMTADDRILNIVREFGERCCYVVVSNDRYVTDNARLLSAEILTVESFAATLTSRSPSGGHRGAKQRGRGGHLSDDVDCAARDNTAGKVSPHDAKRITESLRREWNV